jgi:folate-dependent phosphoribosylglycinamide formyltransferase PurN
MSTDDQYLLKCTKAQRRVWKKRANKSGLTLAAWVRATLDQGPVFITKRVPVSK